jgi:hypothetical protein
VEGWASKVPDCNGFLPKCNLRCDFGEPRAEAIYPQPWSYAKLLLALRSDAQVRLG